MNNHKKGGTKAKEDRLQKANDLLKVIASCGRNFFASRNPLIEGARFQFDSRFRIYYIDDYTGALVYTHHDGEWKGFSHGGGLRRFVEVLRDFISRNEQLTAAYFCVENHWAYDEESILKVRKSAIELGVAV